MSSTGPTRFAPRPLDQVGESEWLLGPQSVAWYVLNRSWVPLIGGLRALAVEALEPRAMRGVLEHSDYLQRPLNRLRRTAAYVAATALGTSAEAERMAAAVRARHALVRGHDPVTGTPYSADDPETQVWVHHVQWYSYLVAHRVFVGDLSAEQEDRFIDEGTVVAELLGTPAQLLPRSVEQSRAYFQRMRPRLCLTDGAVDAIRLVTGRQLPRNSQQLLVAPGSRLLGEAAVATIPRDLRRLMGIDRPALLDVAAISLARACLPLLSRLPVTQMISGKLGGEYFARAARLPGHPVGAGQRAPG